MTQSELAALDAAATQGEWEIVDYQGGSLVIHSDADNRVCFMATPGSASGAMQRIDASAQLIVTLVNLYRANKLVLVPSVESVAEVMCRSLRETCERYAPELLEHLDPTPAYWKDVAKAVLASMGAKSDG